MKIITLLIIELFIVVNAASQDTLFLDEKIEYYTETDTHKILNHKVKGIYNKAKYARELIQDKHEYELVYCFYYDKIRYLDYSKHYKFYKKSDRIIISAYGHTEEWFFQKISKDNFKVSKKLGNLIEVGYAKKLIPLEKYGLFHVLNIQQDTFYSIEYENYIFPKINTIETSKCIETFDYCEKEKAKEIFDFFIKKSAEKLPRLNIGIPELIVLSFSVSKNGQVCNIEFIKSSFCELYQTAILNIFEDNEFKKISKKIKGKKVVIPIRINPY